MTFREYYGNEACQKIRDRLEEFFDSEGGFLFIDNLSENRCTDAYMNICDHHVRKRVSHMLAGAIDIAHPGLELHQETHDHDKH